LHRHNWLSFGKFQDTERFLIHCARHFSSRLPPSGGTCKYAKAPSTKKTLRDFLPIDMLLSALSVLVIAQSISEVSEGLMNNPVFYHQFNRSWWSNHVSECLQINKLFYWIPRSSVFSLPHWEISRVLLRRHWNKQTKFPELFQPGCEPYWIPATSYRNSTYSILPCNSREVA